MMSGTLMFLRRAVVALAMLGGATRALGAQQKPAVVPEVLASAALSMFLGPMFGEGPVFLVGRTPRDFPRLLVPPKPARVEGGMLFGPFRMTAITYPNGMSAAGRYESLLVHSGATRADAASIPRITHGFAPSASESTAQPRLFCLPSGTVSVMQPDSARYPNTVLVMWAERSAKANGVRTPCDSNFSILPDSHAESTELELPALLAPQGVRFTPGGTSGGGVSTESFAYIDTTWTADSLIVHFARQLAKAGWTVGTPASNAETGSVNVSTRNDAGEWRGALSVLTGPDRREVVLRMMRAMNF